MRLCIGVRNVLRCGLGHLSEHRHTPHEQYAEDNQESVDTLLLHCCFPPISKGQSAAEDNRQEMLTPAGETAFRRSLRVGRNHLPQLLNSSLKSALLALVALVSLRQTGHLALESLKPR